MNNENEPPPARNSMIAMALNKQSSLLGLKREHYYRIFLLCALHHAKSNSIQ